MISPFPIVLRREACCAIFNVVASSVTKVFAGCVVRNFWAVRPITARHFGTDFGTFCVLALYVVAGCINLGGTPGFVVVGVSALVVNFAPVPEREYTVIAASRFGTITTTGLEMAIHVVAGCIDLGGTPGMFII